jgi:hypothetical protein
VKADRRGFLKGLAGLATVPFFGQALVKDAQTIEGARLVVPDREIIVPPTSHIVVASELPKPLSYAEAFITRMDIEFPRYETTSWGSVNRTYAQGGMRASAEIIFTGDLDVLGQMRAGTKVRVYFEEGRV